MLTACGGVKTIHISRTLGDKNETWFLELDVTKATKLDWTASTIHLERDGLEVTVNLDQSSRLQRQSQTVLTRADHGPDRDQALRPPQGRDRRIGAYYAIQHQMPAAYGLGQTGVSDSATPQRQVQVQQLKAYLMFFDQLLANYFAQLEEVKELFAFSTPLTHTYFSQMIDDPALGLDGIRLQTPETHRERLAQITEYPHAPTDPREQALDAQAHALTRRNRFLNHLLARFAEQFTDYALMLFDARASDKTALAEKLVQDKQGFLQHYIQIGTARGTAFNDTQEWGPDNQSGLERRVRFKLGLSEHDADRFYLVEHTLLRPMEADTQQTVPLLELPHRREPYSFQLTFVFPDWPEDEKPPGFKPFVEQTVREETPAHLAPSVLWLSPDKDEMAQFRAAYTDWTTQRQKYWQAQSEQPTPASAHIRLRDARDQLLALLELGKTYPIQDLDVRAVHAKVPFDTSAEIEIDNSQTTVMYQLHQNGKVVNRGPANENNPFQVQGTGETVQLVTPPIREPVTYQIRAIQLTPDKHLTNRAAYLHTSVVVEVGLDIALPALIKDAPALDGTPEPPDTAPRLVDYGTVITVELQNSQEGVDYRLVKTLSPSAPEGERDDVELSDPFHTMALDVSLVDALDKAEIEDIRPIFEAAEITLPEPERVTIAVEEPGMAWLLKTSAADAADDQAYAIRSREGRLEMTQVNLVRGTGPRDRQNAGVSDSEINLVAIPMHDDTDIRIRATKIIDIDDRETETDLLDVVLPLKVRANPDLQISLNPGVVDFGKATQLTIDATQAEVIYRVYHRPLRDREVIHLPPPNPPEPDPEVIEVRVPNQQRPVRVRQPALPLVWQKNARRLHPLRNHHTAKREWR